VRARLAAQARVGQRHQRHHHGLSGVSG
jgi:hypothetical protein